jgi:hypothetical protein
MIPKSGYRLSEQDHAQNQNVELRQNRSKEQATMPDLSAFPITARWPARHPDRLQLYSLPTPNGVKVSIMLEEIGLPYEVPSTSTRTTRGRLSTCR